MVSISSVEKVNDFLLFRISNFKERLVVLTVRRLSKKGDTNTAK